MSVAKFDSITNSLRFELPRGLNLMPNKIRDLVVRGIRDGGDESAWKNVVGVVPIEGNQVWQVKFHGSFEAKKLAGLDLQIGDHQVTLRRFDQNLSETIILRILWLPLETKDDAVRECLSLRKIDSKYVKMISREKCDVLDGQLQIETGVVRVKLVVPSTEATEIVKRIRSDLVGPRMFGKWRGFVTKAGDPIKCFYCQGEGHTRAECEKLAAVRANRMSYAARASGASTDGQADELPVDIHVEQSTTKTSLSPRASSSLLNMVPNTVEKAKKVVTNEAPTSSSYSPDENMVVLNKGSPLPALRVPSSGSTPSNISAKNKKNKRAASNRTSPADNQNRVEKKKLKSGSGQSSDDEAGFNDIDSTTQGAGEFEDVIHDSDEESKMDQSTITLANILEKTKEL